MNNIYKYKDWEATISYCSDINCFKGEIIGLSGYADFEFDDVETLEEEFETSIRVYLQICKEHGINPYKEDVFISKDKTLRIIEELYGSGAVLEFLDEIDNRNIYK